jgi:hypothetical protein
VALATDSRWFPAMPAAAVADFVPGLRAVCSALGRLLELDWLAAPDPFAQAVLFALAASLAAAGLFLAPVAAWLDSSAARTASALSTGRQPVSYSGFS